MVAHPSGRRPGDDEGPAMSVRSQTNPTGRGRGIAALNKNLRRGPAPAPLRIPAPVPVSVPASAEMPASTSAPDPPPPSSSGSDDAAPSSARSFGDMDENAQSVLFVEDKYLPLVEQVDILSDKDDGILTNQKIVHIEGAFSKACVQRERLRGAMESLASAAILYAATAKKTAKLISFSRARICQQRLHCIFVAALRDKIDGLEISLDGADQCFVNASTLLTDIYSESKTLNQEDLANLTNLIIQVSVGLLECNTALSLRTLNAQLMVYGKELYKMAPEKFDSVSLSVRKLIIARQPPLPSSRIWLALLSDQCLYRFEPLPQYLQDFYARQLDDSNNDAEPRDSRFATELPNKPNNHPSKLPQTLNDRRHCESGSTNREKRTSLKSDSSDRWSIASNGERKISQLSVHEHIRDEVFDGKCFESELCFENSSYSECYGDPANDYGGVNGQNYTERKPRPILGAGSRMVQSTKSIEPALIYNPNMLNAEDSSADIPKFCPTVPPPNFVIKNNDNKANENKIKSEKVVLSASQESPDFWNYPPPKLPGRLDLNSWRQQSVADVCASESHFDNQMNNSYSAYEPQTQFTDGNVEAGKFDAPKSDIEEFVENINKNYRDEMSSNYDSNVSIWEKKKADMSKENEQNWNRNNVKQTSERRSFEPVKKDPRIKRDSDEKDANWKRRDSDEGKSWDGKSETGDKKLVGRRDSRASRGSKKDIMEVSRKASYWTHDDRCDKDYDG